MNHYLPNPFLLLLLLGRHLLGPLQMFGVDVGGALLVGQGRGSGHDAFALVVLADPGRQSERDDEADGSGERRQPIDHKIIPPFRLITVRKRYGKFAPLESSNY